ncbi:insulin-induced protein-domain-containing protein [Cladochytrium replicatum]|nr:insulin-induced protein-domain-containing protein [Cladochytrium replicatum]
MSAANRPLLPAFLSSSSSLHLPARLAILFCLGVAFSILVDRLQQDHNITRYPPSKHNWAFPTAPGGRAWAVVASWVPLSCGLSATLIGTIYPLLDIWCLNPKQRSSNRREWASVIRCCAGVVGINYAASKFPWSSHIQVSVTLAILALALWFIFDRTTHGFILSFVVAILGTGVVYYLVHHGFYTFTESDFFGMRGWMPCVLYSSCVCFGVVGRQLAVDETPMATKSSTPSAGKSRSSSAGSPASTVHQRTVHRRRIDITR